jgi:hypothetical protein
MNKTILILLIIGTCFSCNTNSKKNIPEIENVNIESIVEKEGGTNKLLMITSSNLKPSKEVLINGIDFTIVENEKKEIIYWSTNDNNFQTPEGYSVGMNWSKIPQELKNSIGKMTGWGYYINLNSGWQLGFCEGSTCTDSDPNNLSNIKWIFKRKE